MDNEADTWDDWDERCHGDKDDQEDDYPESFMWSCCKRRGNALGCKIGTYKEKDLVHKRARLQ